MKNFLILCIIILITFNARAQTAGFKYWFTQRNVDVYSKWNCSNCDDPHILIEIVNRNNITITYQFQYFTWLSNGVLVENDAGAMGDIGPGKMTGENGDYSGLYFFRPKGYAPSALQMNLKNFKITFSGESTTDPVSTSYSAGRTQTSPSANINKKQASISTVNSQTTPTRTPATSYTQTTATNPVNNAPTTQQIGQQALTNTTNNIVSQFKNSSPQVDMTEQAGIVASALFGSDTMIGGTNWDNKEVREYNHGQEDIADGEKADKKGDYKKALKKYSSAQQHFLTYTQMEQQVINMYSGQNTDSYQKDIDQATARYNVAHKGALDAQANIDAAKPVRIEDIIGPQKKHAEQPPVSQNFNVNRVQLYNDMLTAGVDKVDKKDYYAAILDFSSAIQIDDKSFEAYFYRAMAEYNSHREDDALADCNETILRTKGLPLCYYYRGLIKNNKGFYEDAITDFESAIALDPTQQIVYDNMGYSKIKLGRYNEAIVDLSRGIKLAPEYRSAQYAYNYRGYAYYKLGGSKKIFQKAIADYDKAIQLDNNYKPAFDYREDAVKAMNAANGN